MHHIKVGGACLVILLIAAALPVGVLGQAPQTASSASESDNAQSGASSIISQSLAAKSTQEETISAEKVARSNKGLKPLGSASQTAASESPAAAEQAASPAPFAAAGEAEAAAPDAQTDTADDAAKSEETTEIANAAEEEPTITPDEIEIAASAPSVDETEISQAEDVSSATVTPPDNEPLGTAVSSPADASTANESQDASSMKLKMSPKRRKMRKMRRKMRSRPTASGGGNPEDYTWNWESFSGFFYDMENDVGTETLNINLGSGRSVDSGNFEI